MASKDVEQGPNPIDMLRLHLRDVLRYGVSQRYFARETGIPRSTIGDFLRGTHEPSAATMERIAQAVYGDEGLDVDLE